MGWRMSTKRPAAQPCIMMNKFIIGWLIGFSPGFGCRLFLVHDNMRHRSRTYNAPLCGLVCIWYWCWGYAKQSHYFIPPQTSYVASPTHATYPWPQTSRSSEQRKEWGWRVAIDGSFTRPPQPLFHDLTHVQSDHISCRTADSNGKK